MLFFVKKVIIRSHGRQNQAYIFYLPKSLLLVFLVQAMLHKDWSKRLTTSVTGTEMWTEMIYRGGFEFL